MPENQGIALFNPLPNIVVQTLGGGEDMVLRKQGEADVAFKALFDGRHFVVEVENAGVMLSEYRTMIFCRRDAVEACKDDVIIARNAEYKVVDIRKDSESAQYIDLALIEPPLQE